MNDLMTDHLVRAGYIKPPTFHALVGIVGSGKSTYAHTLLTVNPALAYLCPDVWREELTGDAMNQSRNAFIFGILLPIRINGAWAQRKDALFDATNYRRKNRAAPLRHAKDIGYRVVVHVMITPFEVCWERNLARDRVVPRHVYDRMVAGYQEPDMAQEDYIDEIVRVPYENALDSAPQLEDTLSQ